jgi:hypothetical protein
MPSESFLKTKSMQKISTMQSDFKTVSALFRVLKKDTFLLDFTWRKYNEAFESRNKIQTEHYGRKLSNLFEVLLKADQDELNPIIDRFNEL